MNEFSDFELTNPLSVLPESNVIVDFENLNSDCWKPFTESEILEKVQDPEFGEIRKLRTLDATFPPQEFAALVNIENNPEGKALIASREHKKFCPNRCPFCFEQKKFTENILTWKEIKDIVLYPALSIGLENCRFLGPGEFFENPDAIEILDFLKNNNIKILIFTKGNSKLKNCSTKETIEIIATQYPNANLAFDYRSMKEVRANRMIPSISQNFFKERNLAILYAIKYGMLSEPHKPRMSLQTNPITHENIDEVLDIFIEGTKRNIPVRFAPTMVSGKGHRFEMGSKKEEFQKDIIESYAEAYAYLIKSGRYTFERLKKDEVSPYLTPSCRCVTTGMYIDITGHAWMCTGNDDQKFNFGNLREKSLKELWVNSYNYRLPEILKKQGRPITNPFCPAKVNITFPENFQEKVIIHLEKLIGINR